MNIKLDIFEMEVIPLAGKEVRDDIILYQATTSFILETKTTEIIIETHGGADGNLKNDITLKDLKLADKIICCFPKQVIDNYKRKYNLDLSKKVYFPDCTTEVFGFVLRSGQYYFRLLFNSHYDPVYEYYGNQEKFRARLIEVLGKILPA